MMSTTTEADWVEAIGRPAYESIEQMVAALQCDYERLKELRDERDWKYDPKADDDIRELAEPEMQAGDCEDADVALDRIQEDPLSLRIFGEYAKGEWTATNYELLLSTGGPATRIVGDLEDTYATSARLEVQNWFKPWTEWTGADSDVLRAYVGCFCFVTY